MTTLGLSRLCTALFRGTLKTSSCNNIDTVLDQFYFFFRFMAIFDPTRFCTALSRGTLNTSSFFFCFMDILNPSKFYTALSRGTLKTSSYINIDTVLVLFLLLAEENRVVDQGVFESQGGECRGPGCQEHISRWSWHQYLFHYLLYTISTSLLYHILHGTPIVSTSRIPAACLYCLPTPSKLKKMRMITFLI